MRRVWIVLTLVLLGLPIGQNVSARPVIEGDKGWDCRTMGNRTCWADTRVAELAGIIEGRPGWDCRTMGNGVCGTTTSTTEDLASVVLEPASVGITERVNVSSDEEQANGQTPTESVDVSRNGRFVVFISFATNLVPGDTNGMPDLFVRDRLLGTTERVNVSSAGAQADGPTAEPSISADGRFVAFTSLASNLVEDDTNQRADVFVHDRRLDTTERVSVGPLGIEANGSSAQPDINENGGVVVFASNATNLAADEIVLDAGDPVVDSTQGVVSEVFDDVAETDNFTDVFAHTRATGVTERISVNDLGSPATGPECDPDLCPPSGQPYSENPSISADGRYVAFESNAENLVVDDLPLFPSVRLGPSDDNEAADIYLRDRLLRRTQWVSVNDSFSGGVHPAISGDGRFVAFATEDNRDVYVRELSSDAIEQVDVDSNEIPGTSLSHPPAISDNGQKVAFASLAKLAPEDLSTFFHDIYLRDRRAGTTSLESVNSSGEQANGHTATLVAISGNGRAVVFISGATNLVPDDTNGLFDVFVHAH